MPRCRASSLTRYLIMLCLSLLGAFGLQSLALSAAGGRTLKGESNYFSSIARIQEGMRGDPRVMLLGSSRTGRLPDRSRGFEGVANLGCDGASAVVVLRAMAEGKVRPASVLLIEGNTLSKAATHPDTGLADAIGSPWFEAGHRAPLLSATARPSALLYDFLLSRRHGSADPPSVLPVAPTRPQLPDPEQGLRLSGPEKDLVEELTRVLGRLQGQGVRMLVHDLPPPAPPDSPNVRVSREVARRAGVPHWDLATALPADALGYTDGIHLDPPSATRVLMLLLREVEP